MAIPKLDGMRIHQPAWLTPMIVGVKRKYILQKDIGTGAFATVHKAVDHENGNIFTGLPLPHDRPDQTRDVHATPLECLACAWQAARASSI